MIKDVVVNLALNTKRDPACEYAVSLAATFKAYLTGLTFNYDPVIPGAFADGLDPGLIDTQRVENEKAAKAAVARFAAAAKRARISSTSRMLEASFGGAANQFGEIARRFDVSVVGQSDPKRPDTEDLLIEAALFESGRPVVIVPYIQKAPVKFDRMLVCWNRSRNAARAIADAMPFLERAKRIEVLTISGKGTEEKEPAGCSIIDHLIRHGLKVEGKHIVSKGSDVAGTILSHAADAGADFIVMGGYGHSRLREFVLGGATRTMLASMTIPTLMSH